MDPVSLFCFVPTVLIAAVIIWLAMRRTTRARAQAWSEMAQHLGLSFHEAWRGPFPTPVLTGIYRRQQATCFRMNRTDSYTPSQVRISFRMKIPNHLELQFSQQDLFQLWKKRGPTIDADLEKKFAIDSTPATLAPLLLAQPGMRDRLLAFDGPIEVRLRLSQLSCSLFNTEEEAAITPYFVLLADIADALDAVMQDWATT